MLLCQQACHPVGYSVAPVQCTRKNEALVVALMCMHACMHVGSMYGNAVHAVRTQVFLCRQLLKS